MLNDSNIFGGSDKNITKVNIVIITIVITSYSIHYTKLYESVVPYRLATRQYIAYICQNNKVVEGDGFEPSNPKEQIYSLPRLATSLSFHMYSFNIYKMVPEIGLEPTTY